jgi:MarR family transcriptional regulator, transcriptional regulator for hemolysin
MALKAKAFSINRFGDTQVPARRATRPGRPGLDTLRSEPPLRRIHPLEVSTSMEANSSTLDFLLRDVARLLRKKFEQKTRGSGLTRSQWQVLTYLAQNEGINQIGLAELLDVEPITLCRIVDKLQAFGLIERHPHASDRRVWVLYLTPAARPKLMEVRELGDMTTRRHWQEFPIPTGCTCWRHYKL